MAERPSLRLGTRASALAQWQANWVAEQLRHQGFVVELVPIKTVGDVQRAPIASLGATGLFTKELQQALLDHRIDVAVHSLKDLPTLAVPGLCLASVPQRADMRDALVTCDGTGWHDLPTGATMGTGSLRRRAQLLHRRPDLQVADIRGNVDTRLQKLREGQYDAIILAVAGLARLGWQDQITEILATDLLLPAVGQGALGIETRADDTGSLAAVAQLNHADSYWAVLAERALLASLRGGCLAPVGAWARVTENPPSSGRQLVLDAVVLSYDGQQRLHACGAQPIDESWTRWSPPHAEAVTPPMQLGAHLADQLLQAGAQSLIESARMENS